MRDPMPPRSATVYCEDCGVAGAWFVDDGVERRWLCSACLTATADAAVEAAGGEFCARGAAWTVLPNRQGIVVGVIWWLRWALQRGPVRP